MLNYGQKEYIKYRSADAAKALQNFSLNMHWMSESQDNCL